MPVSNADITGLAEFLQAPTLRSFKKAEVAVDELVQHVRNTLPKASSRIKAANRRVRRVIYGGSLAKGTAVKTRFDVDLVFLLDMPVEMFLKTDVLDNLNSILFKCLEGHADIHVDGARKGGRFPSAACKLYGIEFDVLLGACLVKGNLRWAERQLDLVQSYVLGQDKQTAVTAARFLNGSVSQSSVSLLQEETETLKLATVLLKHWRSIRRLKQFKSFSAEMICLHAAQELRQDGVQRLTIRKIFEQSLKILNLFAHSAKEPRVLSSNFMGLHDASEWEGWIPETHYPLRLVMVNPMTPILNVLHSIQACNLRQWSEAAEESLDMLNDPRCSVKDLFGTSAQDHDHAPALAAVVLPRRLARKL